MKIKFLSRPRSQGSLLPALQSERERPWKTLVTCLPESGRLQTNDLGEGQVSVRFVSTEHRQVSAAIVYLTWSWTRKIMNKVLWQRKRNFLQIIWMLIGCLSAMLSFGTCNGNRGGFTVCTFKNNLGILVVVFIPKRTRFELPFICCGGHFRKQMYSICMCFQDYYYARRRKNVSSVAVLTRDLELPRSNRKREYAARTVRLIVSYCSNGKR